MSTRDSYWPAKQLFQRALDLAPGERDAFLKSECGDDQPLALEVRELLAQHACESGETLAPVSLFSPAAPPDELPGEQPGAVIGPYKLLEVIGKGGMGIVYKAQRQDIARVIALKLIKLGMDTQQVVARFESERQALAAMNHPNVAAVYDVGTTVSGRPYFVMEYIDGTPITRFCDEHQFTVRQRLSLFSEACQAIQHAHQKAIIHRDLKPENILVAIFDGKPTVKVIDFGVAKATQHCISEHTAFTETGQLIGTPEYMSPEQADLNAVDIDTRTDIYSLGVILYELLAGTLPFDSTTLRSAGYARIQSIIRDVDPPRPSTRLSAAVGNTAAQVAARRGTQLPALHRQLRGELDWIVMKCLEKDRARRYETANGLAMDVQRYLADEPVTAGAPSARYRVKKFILRNKGPVLATAAILLLLISGVIGTTWGLLGERRARMLATTAAEAEHSAKKTAEARDAESRAVLDFVQSRILAAARPLGQEGGLGHDVTLRKAVEAALPFVQSSFKDQPSVETRLRQTMGLSFWYLGDSRTATEQFEAALALSTKHKGPDHPDTLACMSNLANQYAASGRLTDAIGLREKTLEQQRAKLGPEHRATLVSMNNLANSYDDQGRFSEAVALWEEALPLMRKTLGPDDALTVTGMTNLAMGYQNAGRQTDALNLREESLAIMRRKFGAEYAGAIPLMNGLGLSYDEVGRNEDALKIREETLTLAKFKLGTDHPMTLWAMNNLAISYTHAGRPQEALAIREEVLARRTTLLGADHPDTLDASHNLAYSYTAHDRHADALKVRETTLLKRRALLGSDHPDTLRSMKALAETYHDLSRHADALLLRRETLATRTAQLGPDHPDTLSSMRDVAISLVALNREVEAASILDDCIARASAASINPEFSESLLELRTTLPQTAAPE